MALSIDEITRRLGIQEVSGSFDAVTPKLPKETVTKPLSARNKSLVKETVTKPNSARRNISLTNTAGEPIVVPNIPKAPESLLETIRRQESKPEDLKSGNYTYYEESLANGTTVRNIGPGLNLEAPLTAKLFKKHGIDIEQVLRDKGVHNIEDGNIKIENVFRERLKISEEDAIKYVGGMKSWKALKQNEKDALTNMSYNMGLKALSGFTETKKLIEQLSTLRQDKSKGPKIDDGFLVDSISREMQNSLWFSQVGNRGVQVTSLFAQDGLDNQNFKEFLNGP